MMTDFNVSIIVAVAKHNAIGAKGGLLCHLPADLKHFKNTTSGHTVVMGRRTFDSLPKGALPNRRNIVVTRNPNFTTPGVEVAHSLAEAFSPVADGEVFVIGGAQIYAEALPMASKLYITEIEASFPEADTFFPEIDDSQWVETLREAHEADEKNPYPYEFVILERR